jgi:hypothetical protein
MNYQTIRSDPTLWCSPPIRAGRSFRDQKPNSIGGKGARWNAGTSNG